MQPLSQVRERGEGELCKGVWTFQSAKSNSPTLSLDYIYSPFLLLAVMGKTRTSRTVRDALADCPRLNSNGKNAKSTAGRTGHWAGRTVRLGPVDCPRAGRGPSALSTKLHPVLFGSEESNGPSARGLWTVRLEAYFSRKLLPKTSDIK
jgi:hypothetical protein